MWFAVYLMLKVSILKNCRKRNIIHKGEGGVVWILSGMAWAMAAEKSGKHVGPNFTLKLSTKASSLQFSKTGM